METPTTIYTISRWQTLAPTYNQAVERTLAEIAKQRPFKNWREGKLGATYLRETDSKAKFMQNLAGIDRVTLQVQMGEKYRGRSVVDARTLFAPNEVGLGIYEVAQILLQDPKILSSWDDLWIDCAGDEYSPGADGQFESALCWSFRDGQLKLDDVWVDLAGGRFGSASGFSPQSSLAPRPLVPSRQLVTWSRRVSKQAEKVRLEADKLQELLSNLPEKHA